MGKDLSEEQVSSMKEAFSLFDTDGDGRIAPSELGILMRSLGGNPTQAQLKAIVAEENLTAPFDFPRFLDLMAKHIFLTLNRYSLFLLYSPKCSTTPKFLKYYYKT
ncbi:Putative calcium-binding protein CML7 [Glycine soja]|nr:Putative calcium-binding protein CML7 [Glycine soja]